MGSGLVSATPIPTLPPRPCVLEVDKLSFLFLPSDEFLKTVFQVLPLVYKILPIFPPCIFDCFVARVPCGILLQEKKKKKKFQGFSGDSVVKNLPVSAEDMGSI